MRIKEKQLTIIILISLVIASTHQILFSNGSICYGEIVCLNPKPFIYSWNEYNALGIQNYNFLGEEAYPAYTFYGHIMHYLNPIIKKIYLIILIILPFLSMKKLASHYTRKKFNRITAGLIYTINPYLIERIFASNWQNIIAYSLTPLFLYSLIKGLKNKIKQ